MPSIDIQVLEDVFSAEEKCKIIQRVKAAFGSVAGATIQSGTSVRVHEVPGGAWGYGGQVLTTTDAKAMRKQG